MCLVSHYGICFLAPFRDVYNYPSLNLRVNPQQVLLAYIVPTIDLHGRRKSDLVYCVCRFNTNLSTIL